MKHFIPLYHILLLAALLTGTACSNRQSSYLIGVSQCSDDAWRTQLNKEIIFFPTVTIPRENEFIYFDFSFDRKIRLCRTYPAYKVKILNEFQKMPYYKYFQMLAYIVFDYYIR